MTHVQLLHTHRIQHVSQELMRVLLPEIEVLIVLAAYRRQELPTRCNHAVVSTSTHIEIVADCALGTETLAPMPLLHIPRLLHERDEDIAEGHPPHALLRELAAEGRTILLSSHVLSEVAQTVDDVVVIARGRIVMTGPLDDLASGVEERVRVDAHDRAALAAAVSAEAAAVAAALAEAAFDGRRTCRGRL